MALASEYWENTSEFVIAEGCFRGLCFLLKEGTEENSRIHYK